jgi:hypothetical protein
VSRGRAIWVTAIALALINVGAASIIVATMGQFSFAPLWLGAVFVVVGVGALVGAVVLWRQYLSEVGGIR